MQNQSVSMELRKLRLNAGLSQKELADLLRINVASICRYENGSRIPKRDKMEKMAELFQCSIACVTAPLLPLDTLGSQLHDLRVKSGLPMEQVSERLGISLGTIYHWENDHYLPKPHNLKRLANFYQETIKQIKPSTNIDLSPGEKMREMRIRANFSQALAAERLHCTKTHISRWENNIVAPKRDYLEKMVVLYQCNINDFI